LARCLIIACGCRGAALAGELRADGHAVRGTTRDPARVPELEASGIEPHLGDPDRVATLAPALEHVTVACILLGSARGTEEELADLHGSRLQMLLTRMLDTTARGVVYEAAGTVGSAVLAMGARIVGLELALGCVSAFLSGEFQGGRHARRVAKITALENSEG